MSTTSTIAFGQGPDEATSPTGIVIRTLGDGDLDATLVEGGNAQVNAIARVLVTIIGEVGLEAFVPLARSAAESAGFDVDALMRERDADPADEVSEWPA